MKEGRRPRPRPRSHNSSSPRRGLDLHVRVHEGLSLVGPPGPGEKVRNANLAGFALGRHLAKLGDVVAEAGFCGVAEHLDFAALDARLIDLALPDVEAGRAHESVSKPLLLNFLLVFLRLKNHQARRRGCVSFL